MLWLIRIALSRPYTFVVLALLIVIFGPLVYVNMRTDIFPDIKVPVVSVVWTYSGLKPGDMSDRVITLYERQLPANVNDIEHIESQSLLGMGVVKIFFQPNVNINAAVSQVTAVSQTVLKYMPPGITPPLVLTYNASSVPILQLTLASKTLLDSELFDISNNFIRPILSSVEGAAIPSPYGGRIRQIQVDLDPAELRSRGISPQDVAAALNTESVILPAGTEKIGKFEYNVSLNASPDILDDLNRLPVKSVNNAVIYLQDVAHVRDGSPPQQNKVRINGRPSVLTTIQKVGSASTLDIIDQVKKNLPRLQASAPPGLELGFVGDQSLFVKASVNGVIREGLLAGALTGLMILIFLGSWRSTLIITISIPLSVFSAIIFLSAFGQSLNIMTLGGLALAIGILVDDATVTLENMNWHLEQGKGVRDAIMDGSRQIVLPAFVSLLCICIVFLPMFFLNGVSKFLFVPLAESVIFSLVSSFILSRTLVPTLANYLLKPHQSAGDESAPENALLHPKRENLFVRFHSGFERGFGRIRSFYRELLILALTRRGWFIAGFLVLVLLSFGLVPFLGENFFPSVDAGEIKLHIRAQTGTRIEETARLCDLIESDIRRIIPPGEIRNIVDNIGLPVSGINLTYSNSSPIGAADADIMISLAEGHRPTEYYINRMRDALRNDFPGITAVFLPADIVSQILNFGLPAPIDVQIVGFKRDLNRDYASEVLARLERIPGLADLRIHQAFNQPELKVDVNRTMAQEMGLTEREIANSLLVTLSGSMQTAPNFWLNPKNHVSYPLVVQTPQYRIASIGDLQNLPLNPGEGSRSFILGSVADIQRVPAEGVVSHFDVQPVIDIFGSPEKRDLGAVAGDIEKVLKETASDLPKGSAVVMRGQVESMTTSYRKLLFGILGAIVLIYLLIVVNFQSWLDPFVIISALPAALAGIVWMLFATETSLTVPALIGAILCMGVATANSILVVSFAREKLAEGYEPFHAALEAGFIRFRPVLMTALAMMIGMAPMAFGMGEGGEQNAPLGRAVIGGLAVATCATLLFVPVVFSLVHSRREAGQSEAERDSKKETHGQGNA